MRDEIRESTTTDYFLLAIGNGVQTSDTNLFPLKETTQHIPLKRDSSTRTMSVQSFWDAAAPMIAVTEKHPFLVAMVDGTLEQDNFRYYVVQDALYLADFSDCLRRLSVSAGSKEDSEALEARAKGCEEAEMELHNNFMVAWDISCTAQGVQVEQMPNCLLYTSYLKRIVATKSHAHGLAVLLPCFWVYMHVGKEMLKLREELGDR
jgi:thiaminase/transcriptional activator TenA